MEILMITIYDYISSIYNDFLNNIESSPKLCCLKSVNFDRSCLPDYSNPFLAEYYLLRYAFAYCFEYSYIFSKVLPKKRLSWVEMGGRGMVTGKVTSV